MAHPILVLPIYGTGIIHGLTFYRSKLQDDGIQRMRCYAHIGEEKINCEINNFFQILILQNNKVSSCLSNVKVNSTKWTNAAHFAMASAARRHTNRCASAKRSRTCWRCKENANRTAFWSFNVLTISTTFLSKTV